MKNFKLKKEDVKPLLNWEGAEGCIATDKITVDGEKVGYMYREEPNPKYPDSGWRFFSGTEDDEYLENSDNMTVYALNTICNYDEEIMPYLYSKVGTAYYRDEQGKFVLEEQ